MGVYRSPFSDGSILVGAVFWPRRPLILRFMTSFRPGCLSAPVFRRAIHRSGRYSGRTGPLLLTLWPPGTLGPIIPVFRRMVFWSARYSGRVIPLFSDLRALALWGLPPRFPGAVYWSVRHSGRVLIFRCMPLAPRAYRACFRRAVFNTAR